LDGNSWTPETALVAYTAAASGHRDLAGHWLTWLSTHRTAYGSLPEKVTRSGRPAGPAPLLWSAALVLLTLCELDHR
jgi:GH15 family glucan-1,4-alpha-glucosidase